MCNLHNNENSWFEISFYATIGEHGSGEGYFDFDYILKKAKKFKKECEEFGYLDVNSKDRIEYIGVEGNKDAFAILFVDKDYLNKIIPEYFKDKNQYDKFVGACNEYMKNKKCVISSLAYEKMYKVTFVNQNDGITNYSFIKATNSKECRKLFNSEIKHLKILSVKEVK